MKKIITNRIIRLIFLGFIVIVLLTQSGIVNNLFKNVSTAYANGDLTIDWGVVSGQPIFKILNFLPGDTEIRTVNVTNNASIDRSLVIVGVETTPPGILPGAINFVILENSNILYNNTLSQFFLDSKNPEGIALSTINHGQTTHYTFTATFDQNANNDYQKLQVIFDLKIGVSIKVPDECKNIKFTGLPILGTDKRDVLNGTNGNDLIFGFEGDDIINASNGNDCIVGGSGSDKIHASNGNDIMFGNEGDDWIDGSNGNDIIFGNEGNDKITDGNGNDVIDAGTGNDTIIEGNGNDKIFGGDGDDIITDGNGSDIIRGGSGNDRIDDANGNDKIYGEDGNDYINAGNGSDYVEGGPGNDTLKGGNGNDTLLGGSDFDSATGDLGTDKCEAEVKKTCEL